MSPCMLDLAFPHVLPDILDRGRRRRPDSPPPAQNTEPFWGACGGGLPRSPYMTSLACSHTFLHEL